MKVGREPGRDPEHVRVAREAIGPDAELYVDANGALSHMQALRFAERFAEDFAVRWFEEPVSSDDLDGLALLASRAPAGMDIAAGEYGYMLDYFERMLSAGAVTCLQADVTRCEGITGFLRVAALCQARSLELSAPLRTVDPRTSLLRRGFATAPRVHPRSCPARPAAVRRCA